MTHISVERRGKTFHVPEATVADLIAMMDEQYVEDRIGLLADLEEINADDELRMQKLKELRDTKGLTASLMRSAFNLTGAMRIIRHMVESPEVDEILKGEPDELVWLALRILGFEADEEEASAEGNAQPSLEASTKTP